MKVVALERIII